MDTIKVFESNFWTLIKNNIRNYSLQNIENKDNSPSNEKWCASGETNLSCSICRTEFKDRSQQLEHYKLDWHRYNLKLSLQQKVPVSESEFNKKTENADLSSISGSDSEDDSTEDVLTSKGKVYLKNESGQIIAVHTCLIADKKEIITDDILYPRLFECCQENPQWTILMLGGGHFAGAVFRGQETLVHKTFHCYTVRAGQGGSQSSRDSKSATSQPKSAGASLRRENEQALVKHVNDLVDSWRPLIEDSSLIIYRASGPNNLKVLFGGNPPLLKKTDKRLRSIPFSTRRATFSEVSRVHGLLMSAFIYSNLPEDIRKPAPTKSHINRAKSRERPERPLPVKILSSDSETENDATFRHVLEDLTVSFTDELQEFGDSLTPEQRKKGPKKVRPSKTSKTKKLKEKEDARKKEIIEVIKNGDIDKLGELLDSRLSIIQEEIEPETEKSEEDIRNSFFNEVLDDKGNTPLHIAAVNGQNDMVKYLLKNNSNPCLKNLKHVTVYASIQDKDIRETFKQFAKDNPDKYNYNKAHIPVQTLTEEELAEKKRQRNVIKRQKEKEKKKELEKQRKETEEKERFLKLSDREKSALAAERRIANKTGAILIRCFQCGIDITGKVPFEYSNNKFCAINCLKEHRLSHPVILS